MDPTVDPMEMLKLLLSAWSAHNWLLVVPSAVVLLIWAFRWGVRRFFAVSKLAVWVGSDQGGSLLAILGMVATTVLTVAQSAGAGAMVPQVLLAALWALMQQELTYGLLKKMFPSGAEKAQAVAKEAAAASTAFAGGSALKDAIK